MEPELIEKFAELLIELGLDEEWVSAEFVVEKNKWCSKGRDLDHSSAVDPEFVTEFNVKFSDRTLHLWTKSSSQSLLWQLRLLVCGAVVRPTVSISSN